MARRGKYPTPDQAVSNFTEGVNLSAEKWRNRTTAGADWYREWFTHYFAPRLYPQIPSILALADPYARSRRVGAIVKRASADYRAYKLRQIVTLARPVAVAAAPAPA